MRSMPALSLALLSLALLGAGCATRNEPPARSAPQTSYPSPDYPPQTGEPAASKPAAAQPATAGAPAERQLYGPVGQPGQSAPSVPPGAPMAPLAGSPRPGGAPHMGLLFDAMDADHNGRVTLEEWRTFQEKEFRRMDKNNDGVLTREEMAAPLPARPGGGPGGPGGPGAHPGPRSAPADPTQRSTGPVY